MVLGMMQPYFFPYLGYFDLIHNADKWIVFDTPEYSRHGWINRNRILHPAEGWQYVIAPLQKAPRAQAICDMRLHEGIDWRARITGQLQHYRRSAPFFEEVMALVRECFASEEPGIARFNTQALARTCDFLGLGFDFEYFSELDAALGPVEGPGDWALRTSEWIGAGTYINPPGGEQLFDQDRFRNAGIDLVIRKLPPMEYRCEGYSFIPGMSILDVLMWNGPDRVRGFLDRHKL